MLSPKKQKNKRLLGKYTKVISVLILSSTLFACSSTDEDTSDLPAELTEFDQKFEPKVLHFVKQMLLK